MTRVRGLRAPRRAPPGGAPNEIETDVLEPATPSRLAFADNLKVALVAGVIVAHATMAWTGLGGWVFEEPPAREPLLGVLRMVLVVGVLFGMPLFFLVAGTFTPASLERKGLRRFAADRTIRLLVPMAFFILVFTPPVEYVDPGNAGWSRGYWAFVPYIWWQWPPPPGPTWFLAVLWVFSLAYALLRTRWPRRTPGAVPLRAWPLVVAAATVTAASYLLRLAVPFGEERWHIAVAQAPGWIMGFTIGALAGEQGWFRSLEPGLAPRIRHVAWAAIVGCAVLVGIGVATGTDPELFAGGGTWQSAVFAMIEGVIVVTVSLWLVDLFRRRFNHQGALARELSRAAYAAFLVHQIVLVGLVLASRQMPWPPELKYLAVSLLGVTLSFGFGAAVVRLPGVARIL